MLKLAPHTCIATQIRFNTFDDAYSKVPEATDTDWAGLCRKIERLAKSAAGTRPPRNAAERKAFKATLPAFHTSTLGEPYNVNENVTELTALPIDIDHGDLLATVGRAEAAGIASVFYTSPSHPNKDDNTDRFRVIVPLTEPLAPEHVKHARKALAELLGIGPGQGIETADAISQIFFIGKIHGDDDRDVYTTDGAAVDTAQLVTTKLTKEWTRPAKPGNVKALARVAHEDPDERTAALLEAMAPHWEQLEAHRDALRGLAGYLARCGWSDEQIAAVGHGLAPDRPVTNRIATMIECAASVRASGGETGAGWTSLTTLLPDAAALIEAHAKDPAEPDDFWGVWSASWRAAYARPGSWVNRGRERREAAAAAKAANTNADPGGGEYAPAADDGADPDDDTGDTYKAVNKTIERVAGMNVYQRSGSLITVTREAVTHLGVVRASGAPTIRSMVQVRLAEIITVMFIEPALAEARAEYESDVGDAEVALASCQADDAKATATATKALESIKASLAAREQKAHERAAKRGNHHALVILARGQWAHIRPLDAIVSYPVMRRDGSILATSGYDDDTRTLAEIPAGLRLSVPDAPTLDDARAAIETLTNLVRDFPFASGA